MANLKLIATLSRVFRGMKGLSAVAFNENGEELDSRDINRRRINFNLDKEDSLLGKGKANITIKIIDENGDEVNFTRGQKQFDLDEDIQDFTAKVSSRKRRTKKRIRLAGKEVIPPDTIAPVFEEGSPDTLDENTGAGVVVFDAEATDNSGAPVSYSLAGADADAFSIDSETGIITIKENADFETKSKFDFKVIATDSSQNSTSKSFVLNINNLKDTGDKIQLTSQRDFYDTNTGKIFDLNNNLLTEKDERLSQFDDIINAGVDTFGQGETLIDPSQQDNDVLNVKTSSIQNAEDTFNPANGNIVQNIETLSIEGSGDDSNKISLANFTNLDELILKGQFNSPTRIQNYIDTANVSKFDFSETSNINGNDGFELNRFDNTDQSNAKKLTINGSPNNDIFAASLPGMTVHAGDGIDKLIGSETSSDYIAGEEGKDLIDITEIVQKTDTVSLQKVTSNLDHDIIVGFMGFDNPNNNNKHDILEFDALTFTNYKAGEKVEQATINDIRLESQSGNKKAAENQFIVDTEANITVANLAFIGEKDILAIASDTGRIFYSSNGNFDNNREEIARIDDGTNFVPQENASIV